MNSHAAPPKPIALTSGDPAGIGPDISLLSWLLREAERLPVFAFLGDAGLLQRRARDLGLDVPIMRIAALNEAPAIFPHALPVLQIPLPCTVDPGKPRQASAIYTQSCIERAVSLALSGEASAVVTNPIAKHVLAAAGFPHPGHTEFLGALAKQRGLEARPVMMLAGAGLRVVPVTIHIALADVPGALSEALIAGTAEVAVAGLRRWFGIAEPRLAVTGLNPHAGEAGIWEMKKKTVIDPAIAALRMRGYRVTGPHPADTLFHARARQAYDAVIAMYHDQALIPLKTLAFDEGVNVTLGLPFIRTSPDHGTAFDIAGTGKARPDSLIAALKLAAQMSEADTAAAQSVH
ncbi:MAG: 4-hydroxythreonine-4-phosphate dehydrogenase PdxA [Rhodomicrobium sp.]|nr:4-hydroxythreonine-4-phosphate dehydrogenase PdxA [Rhodomicrobium sp.]